MYDPMTQPTASARMSRNFRTTYYKTLGVPVVQHIVDIDASFAALLSDRTVNVPQLLKLALELGIGPQYRARCWLLLSGVLPPYPAVWDFALQERRKMFVDVVEAAQVLQTKNEEDDDEQSPAGFYDFLELLDEERHQERMPTVKDLKRLVHLHRTYWTEIVASDAPLLSGMDDPRFLRAVARLVCEVLADASERFWCFTRLLELFHDGLELVDPLVPLEMLYQMQVADFEAVFLRTLDARRRRLTADTQVMNLHMLKTSHDEEYARRR